MKKIIVALLLFCFAGSTRGLETNVTKAAISDETRNRYCYFLQVLIGWMVYSKSFKTPNLLLGQSTSKLDYQEEHTQTLRLKQNNEVANGFGIQGFNHYIGKCYDQRG
jgi:hypothetical protein